MRERFVLEIDTDRPERTIDALVGIGRRLAHRPLLIPTWDEASIMVSDHAGILSEHFRFPLQPPGLARSLASKQSMYLLARDHGVPTPMASFPRNMDDVEAYLAAAAFPVMLKGITGNRLLKHAGRKMAIVQTPAELRRLYAEMEDPDDPNLMLQEYIPGGDDAVWMFNGYFDADSRCLLGITGRKLRQTPVYTGATSLGVCLHNEQVDATTRRWMAALGYRGILDIGYRFDARDGSYKVLDVNPRIGGTFRLFVASNGMDVSRAQYLDLTGQPVPPSVPVRGRKWLDDRDFGSSLTYWRDGRLTARDWLASLAGIEETVYFARDDLAPFVQHSAYLLRSAVPSRGHRPDGGAVAQQRIDHAFHAAADEWRDLYRQESIQARIYQERRARALEWIDSLRLPPGSRVLEVGCGAGLTSVDLAGRGFEVTAMDSVPAMVDQTRRLVQEEGVADRVSVLSADTHDLPFPDEAFELVLALGVLPWLHSPERAMAEMTRVLRPGGHLLATTDNAYGMHYILDPRMNPLVAPLRRLAARLLRLLGLRRRTSVVARLDPPRRFRRLVHGAGLRPLRESTLGFGPVTVRRRPVLSPREDLRLHRTLQDLADQGVPIVRSTGAQHMILARRPEPAAGPTVAPRGPSEPTEGDRA